MSKRAKLGKVIIPLKSLVEDADYWIGVINRLKGDYSKAILHFNRAIKSKPKDGAAYRERAIAYYLKENYEKCAEDLIKINDLGIKEVHPIPNRCFKRRRH